MKKIYVVTSRCVDNNSFNYTWFVIKGDLVNSKWIGPVESPDCMIGVLISVGCVVNSGTHV
jgi:hypothetical protein